MFIKKSIAFLSFVALCFTLSCMERKSAQSSDVNIKNTGASTPEYDSSRGEGTYTKDNTKFSKKIDLSLAKRGKEVYEQKCISCHHLTEEKLVGPGWKGITKRRTAEWILNFIVNPDPMIDKDPELQAQLELCLIRMPNQNLDDEQARSVYEFMRKNDMK